MSENDEVTRKVTAQNPNPTQELPAEEPNRTKSFELDSEKPTERVEPAQAPAAETTAPAAATEPARPPTSSIPEAPTFRPENESNSPEPGFVGYITAKRGPEAVPNPGPPQATAGPTSPTAPATPMGHPGIRTSTVVIGLILLAIGVTALTAQLGGITFNPAAVALAVMLGAGVTLMAAAIRRTQKN